jgi:PAS/PAC sensor hybrid histidine kinase (EC 2.7.13.3)
LTLAKQGETAAELEPVDVAEMSTRCWRSVETKRATLDVDIDGSLTVRADRSRLRELLENLYRNAVTHGGDAVTVRVGALDDGFYVADTGPGIPADDRAEVFQAGYSTADDGTGFGLRIVEQVVDAHGWEIDVTESAQGGARFEITGVVRVDR